MTDEATQLARSVAVLRAEKHTRLEVRRASLLNPSPSSALSGAIGGRPAMMVTSGTVDRLYGNWIDDTMQQTIVGQVERCQVKTGEMEKTLEGVSSILQSALSIDLPRDGVIIGVGGGVLLDMVGLAASLFRRGVPHVKVGTTLVAQVDAAIGLKCGVNHGKGKNIVGAFHPPECVLTDGGFLATLDSRQIRCGLSEMIKLAVATDLELFELLERDGASLMHAEERDSDRARLIIDRSIIGMVDELSANPYESDLSRRVDFGHTVSPMYEIATGHALLHGEAVALDMALFSTMSGVLGWLDGGSLARILDAMQNLGISVWHPIMEDLGLLEGALRATTHHRGGNLNLPVPVSIGHTEFIRNLADVSEATLLETLAVLRKLAVGRERKS